MLAYELHNAPAAAAALRVVPAYADVWNASGRGQHMEQLDGRRAEHLLQQLQSARYHVMIPVLGVM